ncbi:MAG: ribosomal protein S18-alanine N-acetyltransferase [Acidobacteriota bacterium]
MSAGVQIRPMEGGDLDKVVALAAQLAEAPHWPRTAYEAAVDRSATPPRICLVATSAEVQVAGFVIASAVGEEAEIESIGVASGLQRRGIGRALLDALIGLAGMRGATEIRLEVRESNGAAAGLYRSAGFVLTGRRRGYYRDPEEDAVLYSLRLG